MLSSLRFTFQKQRVSFQLSTDPKMPKDSNMPFLKTLFALGLIIPLVACTQSKTNYYTQTVQSWQGGNIYSLMKRWGMPDNRMQSSSGNRVYLYKTENYHANAAPVSPTVGVHFTPGGKPLLTTTPNPDAAWNRGSSLACIVAFETDPHGKIINTQIAGSGCYGSEHFARKMGNPNS